jgi:hypothetical protein
VLQSVGHDVLALTGISPVVKTASTAPACSSAMQSRNSSQRVDSACDVYAAVRETSRWRFGHDHHIRELHTLCRKSGSADPHASGLIASIGGTWSCPLIW